MTAESDPSLSKPTQVPVTRQWREENARKQAAYEKKRRQWTAPPPVEAEVPSSIGTRPTRRGPIHDKRQARLDL